MKKINSLNAFLTILIIATSFFGIIRPQDNPESLEDKFKQYSNVEAIDLINAINTDANNLNTPIRRYIKTAQSDFNDPQFWMRSNTGTLISQFLCHFIFDRAYSHCENKTIERLYDSRIIILVDAALGWGFSVLPYLSEKNSLSDTVCHMVNHAGVQFMTPILSSLHDKYVCCNDMDKYVHRFNTNLYSSFVKAFLGIYTDVTSAKNSNQS